MKTRDEQAEEYLKSNYGTLYKSENKSFARIVAYRAFRNGWDAALKSQWRDAREELPEKSGDYLVSYENGVKAIVYWDSINQDWQDYNGDSIDNYDEIVKYWMPIPELPCPCASSRN